MLTDCVNPANQRAAFGVHDEHDDFLSSSRSARGKHPPRLKRYDFAIKLTAGQLKNFPRLCPAHRPKRLQAAASLLRTSGRREGKPSLSLLDVLAGRGGAGDGRRRGG